MAQQQTHDTTQEISPDQWVGFLAQFTRENRGAHGELEVLGGEIARVVEVENRPFDGISADTKDGERAVWILFGFKPEDRLTHGIQNATVIRVRPPAGHSGATVEVEAADGSTTLLELSRPEDFALPPPGQ